MVKNIIFDNSQVDFSFLMYIRLAMKNLLNFKKELKKKELFNF